MCFPRREFCLPRRREAALLPLLLLLLLLPMGRVGTRVVPVVAERSGPAGMPRRGESSFPNPPNDTSAATAAAPMFGPGVKLSRIRALPSLPLRLDIRRSCC